MAEDFFLQPGSTACALYAWGLLVCIRWFCLTAAVFPYVLITLQLHLSDQAYFMFAGVGGLGVQSTGRTFGPPVSTLSFLSRDCPWTYRRVLSLGVQARPRSGQMWMSQEAVLNHGGRGPVSWGMTILALCSWQGQFQGAFCIVAQRISSGSYPTFQKVSFLPSLTPPTSSFCVPGIVSKISSLYSILRVSS